MLAKLLPDGAQARNVRVLQVGLAVLGIFLVLNWMEARPSPVDVGSEHLTVGLAAPVEHPRGPWGIGHVFVDSGPGIPLDVAPNATITAVYASAGLQPTDEAWTATLHISEVSDGLSWWSIDRELSLDVQGNQASVRLDLSALMQEAQALEAAADVPGTLTASVDISHSATVAYRGGAVALRTATVELGLADRNVVVETAGDEGVYREPARTSFPLLGAAALAAALGLEGLLAVARRRWQAWERFLPSQYVLVEGVHVPPDAVWTDLASLMRTARRSHQVALIDPTARIALLAGPVALAADVPASGKIGDPEAPTPPPEPAAPEPEPVALASDAVPADAGTADPAGQDAPLDQPDEASRP